VIWLVWRRNRALLYLVLGVLAAMVVWMLLMGRSFEHSGASYACQQQEFNCATNGILRNEATAITFLLLFLPCGLGIFFGAPLVAGELEHYTNRLLWTQSISRTKWLVVKWLTLATVLVACVVLLTLVTQWWSGHVSRVGLGLGNGRIQPLVFPITGPALPAYTAFAVSLGAFLGAVIRKTSWAIVGLVVAYTAVSVVMVFVIRPSLAPQRFIPAEIVASGHGIYYQPQVVDWNLGFGFRYAPSADEPAGTASADVVANRCQAEDAHDQLYAPYLACLTTHHIQMGTYYQPADHYWQLQWRESALLVGAAILLFAATVWSVRRWRA
jgi:hypothetical protein